MHNCQNFEDFPRALKSVQIEDPLVNSVDWHICRRNVWHVVWAKQVSGYETFDRALQFRTQPMLLLPRNL